MATILDVARLKGLLTEARRMNEAAQCKLAADNKEFIERMTAIAHQFGIEH